MAFYYKNWPKKDNLKISLYEYPDTKTARV